MLTKELFEEIEENVLNLLLFDEMINDIDKNRIIENCNSDFFTDERKRVFVLIDKLKKQKRKINIMNLLEFIDEKDYNVLCELEMIRYSAPLIAQIQYYLENLFQRYIQNAVKEANNIDDIEKINILKEKFDPKRNAVQHISANVDVWEKRYKDKENTCIYTTYKRLDDIVGSFNGGDYIALGGGTGQGKTAFALNIAKNVAMCDKKVLYCSLEMPLEQLQNRFNCITSGLNSKKVRTFNFNETEFSQYIKGLKSLKDWPIYVSTNYKLTIDKLEDTITIIKPDFVIIDYLGLMSYNGNNSMYEKVTNLSRQIKILATEYNIPIMVLVQLNRDIKNRQDKHPVLSDIRESGAIEQDADFVLFVHREYYYSQDTIDKDKIEIIIAKNRHGESGLLIPLFFNVETQEIK